MYIHQDYPFFNLPPPFSFFFGLQKYRSAAKVDSGNKKYKNKILVHISKGCQEEEAGRKRERGAPVEGIWWKEAKGSRAVTHPLTFKAFDQHGFACWLRMLPFGIILVGTEVNAFGRACS